MNRSTNKFHCNLRHPTKSTSYGEISCMFQCSTEKKELANKAIEWCIKKFGLSDIEDLKILVKVETLDDCWGYCEQEIPDSNSYIIGVEQTQKLRDFIMTIVHEMIHLKQYITNEWEGDGEEEAIELESKLTDELWKEGIL